METHHPNSDISTMPEEPCPDKSGTEVESRAGAVSVDAQCPLPPHTPASVDGGTAARASSDEGGGGTVTVGGSLSPTNSHTSINTAISAGTSGVSSSARSARTGSTATTAIRASAVETKHSGGVSVGSAGGAESAADLDALDVLRFRSKFLQTVEELKMRREADVKKEKRIRKLMEEKHRLQQKCDEVESGYSQHLESCSHQEEEIKKQFTSRIRQLAEDKARQVCLEETRHKEIKALKDEIRALQLSKYNLEKKVEDQGRQLVVGGLSRESILSEMSGVETKYQTILAQVTSTASQMTHLEANVKEAVEMNRRLGYVNEHQKCLLTGLEAELESTRRDLVQARGSSMSDRLSWRGGERETPSGRKATAHELKMTTELNKQLTAQLAGVRGEHQTLLDQLKEAHSLLDKHIESSNRAQDSEKSLGEEVQKLQESKERLDEDLMSVKEELALARQELATGAEEWKTKAGDVEERLKRLQEDYSHLQQAHDVLETKRNDCESSLRSEVDKLLREREERGAAEEEKVRDMEEKVRGLEMALREAETTQQRVKNLEDKEVQVSVVPSPAAISPQQLSLPLQTHSITPLVTGRHSPTGSVATTPDCVIVEVAGEPIAVGAESVTTTNTEPRAVGPKSSTEPMTVGDKPTTTANTSVGATGSNAVGTKPIEFMAAGAKSGTTINTAVGATGSMGMGAKSVCFEPVEDESATSTTTELIVVEGTESVSNETDGVGAQSVSSVVVGTVTTANTDSMAVGSKSLSSMPMGAKSTATTTITTESMAVGAKSMSSESALVGAKPVTSGTKRAKSAVGLEGVKPSNNEANGVPRPPNQSPEVICSLSPDEDPVIPPSTPVGGLALQTPQLRLQRIQLPVKIEEGQETRQSSKEVSILKRRFGQQQQQQQMNFNTPTTPNSNDAGSPAKKQKLLPQNYSVTTGKSSPQDSGVKTANLSLETGSQSERNMDSCSFVPLSQPSSMGSKTSNRDHEGESLSLSQSAATAESRCNRKGKSIPWRIELPASFYAGRKPSRGALPSTEKREIHASPAGALKTTPNRKAVSTAGNQNPQTPCMTLDKSPAGTERKNSCSHTPLQGGQLSLHPTVQPTPSHSPLCTEPPSAVDQSVPHSPGGNSNFAIVFSDGEEEEGEEEGRGKDNLLSSQMNRQIQKVTNFLKMDRLRRTKVPKP